MNFTRISKRRAVPHGRLLIKLVSLGISRNTLKITSEFVSDSHISLRSFVKYCFHHSKIKFISSHRRVISSLSLIAVAHFYSNLHISLKKSSVFAVFSVLFCRVLKIS